MNENSVITKTRRRKLCMAASDPEKPLAVITHVAFGNGGAESRLYPWKHRRPSTANSPAMRWRA